MGWSSLLSGGCGVEAGVSTGWGGVERISENTRGGGLPWGRTQGGRKKDPLATLVLKWHRRRQGRHLALG